MITEVELQDFAQDLIIIKIPKSTLKLLFIPENKAGTKWEISIYDFYTGTKQVVRKHTTKKVVLKIIIKLIENLKEVNERFLFKDALTLNDILTLL